jgi:hypothetical protein
VSGAVGRRPAPPDLCDHRGPTTVERTEWAYRVRCTTCGKAGPVRITPEAAHKALLVLGVWDGSHHEGNRYGVAGDERLRDD